MRPGIFIAASSFDCRMSSPNESLWTLLIASLTAFAGYALVIIASRIERQRKESHTERFDDINLKL
jgi:hypothetical protein